MDRASFITVIVQEFTRVTRLIDLEMEEKV